MKRHITALGTATILFIAVAASHGQSQRGKWGLGLNGGGQRIYGDNKAGWGAGVEGSVRYRVAPMADVIFSAGYSQLKFLNAGFKRYPNLINADLKTNLEILSEGPFRPFLTGGVGLVRFGHSSTNQGDLAAAYFGGGGFNLQVAPQVDLFATADYRFTTTDQLDDPALGGKQGRANDGYLNLRAGVTYYLASPGSDIPQVLAMEQVPFDQMSGEPNYTGGGQRTPTATGDVETKGMEEYIRLKSRIDELVENIDEQEGQISRLQNDVQQKKSRVSALANRVPAGGGNYSPPRRGSSFASMYEQALTHIYAQNYSQALPVLRQLLAQYASHSLAGNCQYWVGECFFNMGRYDEAVDALYKVLEFSSSPKKDDALFMLGRTYLKTGAGESAREAFERLLREYPASEHATAAQDYLSKL